MEAVRPQLTFPIPGPLSVTLPGMNDSLPVYLATRAPDARDRTTVLVRLILVIPQYIVLFFVHIAALVVAVLGWFGALVTGRLPDFAREFLTGVLRWDTRVQGYLLLLTDEYPPFSLQPEEQYAVQIAVPPPTDLNRLAVLFRIFIAIPAAIVSGVLSTGAFLISIASWFSIVATGQMPPPIYEAVRASLRFQIRYWAYLLMLTPEYPAAVFGDTTQVGAVDEAWLVRLSPQGRTAMIVIIVLGVIVDLLNYGNRL